MIGGFYTHFALGDSFERMAPSLVFGLLLVCRFIILYQVTQRENKELEEYKKKLLEDKSNAKEDDKEEADVKKDK